MLIAIGLTFVILTGIGMPIAFSLGLGGMAGIIITGTPFALIPQRLFTSLDVFALIAIPMFILAGEIMSIGGILPRLMDFAKILVGRLPGGMAHINILGSMIFGGINGSAVADASAIGSMLIPSMTEAYKDPKYATAITACSSVVGPVIPPSIPMIIYAFMAGNTSVGELFLAGIIPGVLFGGGMMVIAYFVAVKRHFPLLVLNYTLKELFIIIYRFLIAFMLPVIIVGGIVSGIFTPSEAGGVAVVYALLVGFTYTRELTLVKLINAFWRTGVVTGVVFMMIGTASIVSWLLTTQQIPLMIANFLQSLTSNPTVFMFLIMCALLLIGLVMETAAAMIMVVPILVPIAEIYGIDPIHLGLTVVLSLLIGLVTPPVGICLFICCSIGKTRIEEVFVESIPYIIWMTFVLIILVLFPKIFLWVPAAFGF